MITKRRLRRERDRAMHWWGVCIRNAAEGHDQKAAYREALKQIMARAQAIPANPIANDIEDVARRALEGE